MNILWVKSVSKSGIYIYHNIIQFLPNLPKGTFFIFFREKYIRRFNDYILSNSQTKNHIAVWMFLDAVLDNSFTELETHNTDWPFPCQKLIPTIVKWCPQLIKLTIHHSKHSVSGDIRKAHRLQLQEFKLSFLSLRSLLYLTQLSLLNMCVHINRIVLPSLEKACPSLSRLSISTNGNDFLNSDILPLILGESCVFLENITIVILLYQEPPSLLDIFRCFRL